MVSKYHQQRFSVCSVMQGMMPAGVDHGTHRWVHKKYVNPDSKHLHS